MVMAMTNWLSSGQSPGHHSDKERVYFHTETINLLTGVSEGITTVNYSISFTNLNNP